MKKSYPGVLVFAFFFLILIQMAGTLVESIYILDLMNTALDEKALGLLFFFSPVLLLVYRQKLPAQMVWILFGILFLARGFTPWLNTLGRMLTSGIATGAGLLLFPFLLTATEKGNSNRRTRLWVSAGLALAIGLSIFLRTMNYGLDYSLFPEGGWVGWVLGAALGWFLTSFEWTGTEQTRSSKGSPTSSVFGIFLILALALFAFSAPAVIARWTEGNYILIVSVVSLLALGWLGISFASPRWIKKITPTALLIWNLLFTLALVLTILAHRVPFPPTPDSPTVVVGSPTLTQQLPLILMLLLFPVIFVNLHVFSNRIQEANPAPRDLAPGILLGSLSLVLLVFMQVFTNIWGYIEPVSPWFRNKFWLPYLLMAGLAALLIGRKGLTWPMKQPKPDQPFPTGWMVFLALAFIGTTVSAFYTTRVQVFVPRDSALIAMTFNIQQANDDDGERSYREQLALIREIAPDILALQESDSTRVSLNNNDYVRYYAGKLGYHSYFGPTTVSGTYGTAILSRYPIQNPHTAFSYSDLDEIGTAEAEINIGEQVFTVCNVHPDGSDTAMLVFAETLRERTRDKSNVIALGDYNLRDYEAAYQRIDEAYTNAWVSVYPSETSPDASGISHEDQIDHIFFSDPLRAANAVYILPPDSATDHPVHWAEIVWD